MRLVFLLRPPAFKSIPCSSQIKTLSRVVYSTTQILLFSTKISSWKLRRYPITVIVSRIKSIAGVSYNLVNFIHKIRKKKNLIAKKKYDTVNQMKVRTNHSCWWRPVDDEIWLWLPATLSERNGTRKSSLCTDPQTLTLNRQDDRASPANPGMRTATCALIFKIKPIGTCAMRMVPTNALSL